MSSEQSEKICIKCGAQFFDDAEVCAADGTGLIPKYMAALIGSLFDERYRILSLLGYGGAGAVYKAKHQSLQQIVAIKVLHPKMIDDANKLARFEREGKALSSLSHINVISAHDYGVTKDKVPYLVMQYVEGHALDQVIAAENGLDPILAVELFIQTCDGLAHAHKKGIIHRDLKPANIVLVKAGDGSDLVKIVDFGLAKVLPDSGLMRQKLTQTGSVFGSPSYMSPEQWQGKAADARSDLYSLGVVMYHTLCGRVPYEIEELLEVMLHHALITPQCASAAKPGLHISEKLENSMQKLLEIDRDKRHKSVSEVKADLEVTPEYRAYWEKQSDTKQQKFTAIRRKHAMASALKRLCYVVPLLVGTLGLVWWANFADSGVVAVKKMQIIVQSGRYPHADARAIDARLSLVEVYERQGRYFEAAQLLEEVRRLVKEKGATSVELANIDNRLSGIYADHVRDERKASEYTRESMFLFEFNAMSCERQHYLDKAIDLCRKGLRIRERLLPFMSRDYAQALYHLAGLELAAGEVARNREIIQQAVRDYENTLARWQQFPSPGEETECRALLGLARAYSLTGRVTDADNASKRAAAEAREAGIDLASLTYKEK